MKFSQGIQRMTPPATRVIAEKTDELKASGKQVLSLASGEPSFAAPEVSNLYARKALEEGRTFYSPTAGILELREEVAGYYLKRFGLRYDPGQIIIGAGAKPLIFETLGALIDEGDEVIVFAPAWVSYVEQIRFFGGQPIICENDPTTYDIDIDRLSQRITSRTIAIIINSPQNPTGKIFDQKTIEAVCDLALKHGLMLINDEVYERITFNDLVYRNPLCFMPGMSDHIVSINAVSKTYSMTGWRIGYALGPEPVVKKIKALQGHLTSGACSVAQWAAVGAIREAERDVLTMVRGFEKRRAILLDALSQLPSITFSEPAGAFYVFVDIRNLLGQRYHGKTIETDLDFVQLLLETKYVSTIPGSAFLFPGYIRISFTQQEDDIQEGVERLKSFILTLD